MNTLMSHMNTSSKDVYGVICDMSHMSHITHELYENTHVTYEYVVDRWV